MTGVPTGVTAGVPFETADPFVEVFFSATSKRGAVSPPGGLVGALFGGEHAVAELRRKSHDSLLCPLSRIGIK
jgi:hypothetical protein